MLSTHVKRGCSCILPVDIDATITFQPLTRTLILHVYVEMVHWTKLKFIATKGAFVESEVMLMIEPLLKFKLITTLFTLKHDLVL